jgi:hypothetical protein
MVRIGKTSADVLHGHPQKAGSKTDKPEGTVMKSYSYAQYGKAGAIRRAYAMHSAVKHSEARKAGLE